MRRTFVCRVDENTEMMKCICGICKSKKLEAQLTTLQKENERLEGLREVARDALLEDHARMNHVPGGSPTHCLICKALSHLSKERSDEKEEK
jgi:hypothetical protein